MIDTKTQMLGLYQQQECQRKIKFYNKQRENYEQ